ncbi:MAG TPA: hypothetical protein VIO61_06025 [Anaerolineaceae bacterium]
MSHHLILYFLILVALDIEAVVAKGGTAADGDRDTAGAVCDGWVGLEDENSVSSPNLLASDGVLRD